MGSGLRTLSLRQRDRLHGFLTWTEVLIILIQALYVGLVSCRDAYDKKLDLGASETAKRAA